MRRFHRFYVIDLRRKRQVRLKQKHRPERDGVCVSTGLTSGNVLATKPREKPHYETGVCPLTGEEYAYHRKTSSRQNLDRRFWRCITLIKIIASIIRLVVQL